MRIAGLLAFTLLMGTGCADPDMQAKLASLDKRVQDLEAGQAEAAKAPAAAAPGAAAKAKRPPQKELSDQDKAGLKLIDEARVAVRDLDFDTARGKLGEFDKEYTGTAGTRAAMRLKQEVEVVGKSAGDAELAIEKWYVGQGGLSQGKATMLVFFESWCGYCNREAPKLEARFQNYKDKGLNMIGLTKVTKKATDDSVKEFIERHKITFPVGKESGGKASDYFAVQGVPAAAVVKDGHIVWRGHPGQLTDEMVAKLIGA